MLGRRIKDVDIVTSTKHASLNKGKGVKLHHTKHHDTMNQNEFTQKNWDN
jgi:hypothetical protein